MDISYIRTFLHHDLRTRIKNMKCNLINFIVSIECDGGFFGLNCTEPCGMCFEKEQCHHINGSCLKGCDYGYSGINCTNDEGMCLSIEFKLCINLLGTVYPLWLSGFSDMFKTSFTLLI